MKKIRVRRYKDKRVRPKGLWQDTAAYVEKYFRLNPQFKPVTYLIGDRKVRA